MTFHLRLNPNGVIFLNLREKSDFLPEGKGKEVYED